MSDLEIQDLREKNNEMVQKIQHWKMTAAQRENEKLDLMKENNELRLKLARLRSGEAAHTRKLDAELQSASEEALSRLVQASNAVARMLDRFKAYVQEKEELDTMMPRWSNLSNTPPRERINRVPPMLFGGRNIQPVVSLSRTLLSNNSRTVNRSPNQQSHTIPDRAVPIRMLQDVFIPLTRIDAEIPINIANADRDTNMANDSTEDIASDDSEERMVNESQNITDNEDYDSPRLDILEEDVEPEDEETPISRSRIDNPLEGPSWLLDRPNSKSKKMNKRMNLESDSTTEFNGSVNAALTPGSSNNVAQCSRPASVAAACEFTPTVRRRKRTSTPPPASPISPRYSPRPARRNSNSGRILKVMVAKMRLDEDDRSSGDGSPPKKPNLEQIPAPKAQKIFHISRQESSTVRRDSAEGSPQYRESPSKRLMRLEAPSPNGSTDSRVIVLETNADHAVSDPCCSGVSKRRTTKPADKHENRNRPNHSNHDSDHNKNDHRTNGPNASRCEASNAGVTLEAPNQNHDAPSQNPGAPSQNREASYRNRETSHNSVDSRDSDSSGGDMVSEGRSRRPRKAIVYKEKPLNRKLRR